MQTRCLHPRTITWRRSISPVQTRSLHRPRLPARQQQPRPPYPPFRATRTPHRLLRFRLREIPKGISRRISFVSPGREQAVEKDPVGRVRDGGAKLSETHAGRVGSHEICACDGVGGVGVVLSVQPRPCCRVHALFCAPECCRLSHLYH